MGQKERPHPKRLMAADEVVGVPLHLTNKTTPRDTKSPQLRVGDAVFRGCQTSWWRFLGLKVSEGQAGCLPHKVSVVLLWSGLLACSRNDELCIISGLLGRPWRPSVERAAWSSEGGRKECDHAARASGGLLLSWSAL